MSEKRKCLMPWDITFMYTVFHISKLILKTTADDKTIK